MMKQLNAIIDITIKCYHFQISAHAYRACVRFLNFTAMHSDDNTYDVVDVDDFGLLKMWLLTLAVRCNNKML